MKIPNLFIPGKDLENATNTLLNQPETSDININSLILDDNSGFPIPICNEKLGAGFYPILDESEIEKKVLVIYQRHMLHILKFDNEKCLSDSIKNIKEFVKNYNSRPSNDLCAIIKDEYAIFMYIGTKDGFKAKAVDFYKQRFGFEEIKA